MQQSESPLEVASITKKFGGLVALKDVSFAVNRGELLGLIGPNGSGKTTMINVITGAYRPEAGKVLFEGRDISKLRPYEICRAGVSRTYQIPRLFKTMTTLGNVAVGALFGKDRNVPIQNAQEIAKRQLEFIGLPEGRQNQSAEELTLLESKKVEIARAMATEPSVLLLDEPLCGLNPVEIDSAVELIRRIRDTGKSILVVEHVMRVIMNLTDRLVVLNQGMKIAEGKPREVVDMEEVVTAYLGEKIVT